jgi:hypothetical protein
VETCHGREIVQPYFGAISIQPCARGGVVGKPPRT